MTPAKLFMNVYGWGAMAITIVGLAYVLIVPPPSMRVDRDGVSHFAPQVMHPITGDPVTLNELIRHYRGD